MVNEIVAVGFLVVLAVCHYRSSLPYMGLLLITTLLMMPAVMGLARYGWWPGGPEAANTALQWLAVATVWLIILGVFRYGPRAEDDKRAP